VITFGVRTDSILFLVKSHLDTPYQTLSFSTSVLVPAAYAAQDPASYLQRDCGTVWSWRRGAEWNDLACGCEVVGSRSSCRLVEDLDSLKKHVYIGWSEPVGLRKCPYYRYLIWQFFCVLCFQRAAWSRFQTCILNSHQGRTMCGSMADIQSAAAKIRRGKKKNKLQHENIYGLPYSIGRPLLLHYYVSKKEYTGGWSHIPKCYIFGIEAKGR